MSTSNTDSATAAEQAMAMLQATPDGGYSIRSGCREEFEQILFDQESDFDREVDYYTFDDGDGDYLALYLEWGNDEFFIQG